MVFSIPFKHQLFQTFSFFLLKQTADSSTLAPVCSICG